MAVAEGQVDGANNLEVGRDGGVGSPGLECVERERCCGCGQQVNAHVCFAEHMCRRLRGDDGTGAGGDRLQKWKMHLGIVSNPVYVALFTALLDFDDYFQQRHAWCLAKDRQNDFPPPFHAREVAVRMCQDESQLKDAIDLPKLIFARTTKFLETPSLHPNKLADADKTELETRMLAAATDMHSKHRDWNWQQWTRGRLLFGVATDEVYRLPFVQALLPRSSVWVPRSRSSCMPPRRSPLPCPTMTWDHSFQLSSPSMQRT